LRQRSEKLLPDPVRFPVQALLSPEVGLPHQELG
jgi:hypothetical protein